MTSQTSARPASASTPEEPDQLVHGEGRSGRILSAPCHERDLRTVLAGRTARIVVIGLLGYAVFMLPLVFDDPDVTVAGVGLLIAAAVLHLAAEIRELAHHLGGDRG